MPPKNATAAKAPKRTRREFVLEWPKAYPSWDALEKMFRSLSRRKYANPKLISVKIGNHKERHLQLQWTEPIAEGSEELETFEKNIPYEYKTAWDQMCYNVVYWMHAVKFLHGRAESRSDLKLAYKMGSLHFVSYYNARELVQECLLKYTHDTDRLLVFDEYIIKERLSLFDAKAADLAKEKRFDLNFNWRTDAKYWLGRFLDITLKSYHLTVIHVYMQDMTQKDTSRKCTRLWEILGVRVRTIHGSTAK